ncbi:MAG: hypothetical protein QXN55_01470 [Candidatus Nitrosotenuis sp.]
MPINSCSINGFTINGVRCSSRYAHIVPIPTEENAKPRSIPQLIPNRWKGEEIEVESPIETSAINVAIEFNGIKGSVTHDVDKFSPTVFVTGLTMSVVNAEVAIDSLAINKQEGYETEFNK